ncbi:hypothetical protein JB92DRAFT_3107894 [Gautieria morchelliformis]|nr:hypothetical protein JB92DRAFT_3107894 [Gautieria morchelliformis]
MLAAPLPLPPSPPRSTGAPTIGRRTVLGETSQRPSHPPARKLTSSLSRSPMHDCRSLSTRQAKKRMATNSPRVSGTKENRPEIHKMGDGTLSRRRGAQRITSALASRITPVRDPPTRVAFVPFRDDEDASAMPPPAATNGLRRHLGWECQPTRIHLPHRGLGLPPTGTSRPSVLTAHTSLAARVKKGEIASEAEALRRDPFKNYGVQPDDV